MAITLLDLDTRITANETLISEIIGWKSTYASMVSVSALDAAWDDDFGDLEQRVEGIDSQLTVLQARFEASGAGGSTDEQTRLANIELDIDEIQESLDDARDGSSTIDSRLDAVETKADDNETNVANLLAMYSRFNSLYSVRVGTNSTNVGLIETAIRELIGNRTLSGAVVTVTSGLVTAATAGVHYIEGRRVAQAAASHTVSNGDTKIWVIRDSNDVGTLASGTTVPSTNALLLYTFTAAAGTIFGLTNAREWHLQNVNGTE